MNDALNLVPEMRAVTDRLMFGQWTDSIEVDRTLGELEAIVYRARQFINDEWRAARAVRKPKPTLPRNTTLEDLI